MSDDDFEPKLGRIGNRGGSKARRYLGRVIAATALAGRNAGAGKSGFHGSQIGRGASMGRLLSSRDRHAGSRGRRVVVKTRLVKPAGTGGTGALAHLRYIQRDGVTREGLPGELYSADLDTADGKTFLDRSAGDRHQFRFIVSAEDGNEYPDLKPFVRRLMAQVGEDLGTTLDWVAVDHANTGHPHTHIMLRGQANNGKDLIIARDYIAHGLRERAVEIVTLDLGPRTDLEIEARLRHDITAERLTTIDRALVRDMDADRIVSAARRDAFDQSLRAGRLQTLGRLGLADDIGAGRWRLADGLQDTLRSLSERGDIIRTMQRELTARSLVRSGVDQTVFNPADGAALPIVGRVVARGLADEHRDRHYLLVDGIDGRTHYVDIGRGDASGSIPEGSIVRVVPRGTSIREVDRTVDAVARASGGRYTIDLHLKHDPAATEEYANAHVRRLEAMRRLTGSVERENDGTWRVADDHLSRAQAFELRQARDRPVTIETVSTVRLERMPHADAATWLDRTLVGVDQSPIRDAGFGQEVRAAQARRRQWLIGQGLADEEEGAIRYRANLLVTLQRRELLRVAGQLSNELGLDFSETPQGGQIEGVLRRHVDLTSGRHALVEKSREFTLVPWRPTLERQVGKQVTGILRGDRVSWSVGRERPGPSIS